MAFIPADETVRIAINYRNGAGNTAVNVIYVKTNEAPVTGTVLTEMADVVEAWLENWWDSVASNYWTAYLLELRDQTLQNSIGLDRTVDAQGTLTGDPLPSQNTIAMSLRTGFTGRTRRGRLYHVGLTEGMVAGDYVAPSSVAGLIAVYDALRTALSAADFIWVVASYQLNGAPRSSALLTPITSVIVTDSVIDSQDRRKPKS